MENIFQLLPGFNTYNKEFGVLKYVFDENNDQ